VWHAIRSHEEQEVPSMPTPHLYVKPVPERVVAELEQLRRQAVGRVSQRAHMVLLSLQHRSVDEIAAIFACGEEVVRLWLHRFEQRGERRVADALDDRPRSGRPPKDRLAGHIIDARVGQCPQNFGLLATCWAVPLLAAHLATVLHLVLAPATIRGYLHRLGWRWSRPKLTLTNLQRQWLRRDPTRLLKLARLQRVLQWATTLPDLLHLVCVDETDLCLLPVIRSCWQKPGRRLEVPTHGVSNPKRTLFGALDVHSGRWCYHVGAGRTSAHFVTLLDQLAAAYPTGLVVIALDSAPAHTAKRITRWITAHPRFRLLWLPKYTAHQVNPVERIWGHLKTTIAANRYYGQIERLVEAAHRYFAERSPQQLRRLAGCDPTPDFLLAA
jgi:transposase